MFSINWKSIQKIRFIHSQFFCECSQNECFHFSFGAVFFDICNNIAELSHFFLISFFNTKDLTIFLSKFKQKIEVFWCFCLFLFFPIRCSYEMARFVHFISLKKTHLLKKFKKKKIFNVRLLIIQNCNQVFFTANISIVWSISPFALFFDPKSPLFPIIFHFTSFFHF